MYVKPVSARDQFTQQDFSFLVETLTPAEGTRETLHRMLVIPEEANRLFDHPALANQLEVHHHFTQVSLRFYLYIMLRRSLLQIPIESREVCDYLANMLARFMERQQWRTAPRAAGQKVDYEYDLVRLLENASPYERFQIHAFGGDRNLFMTGLQAAFIRKRKDRYGAPGVRFYEQAGRGHYQFVRDHPLAGELAMRETFAVLADDFPKIRGRLNYLAGEYFN